MSEQRHRWRRAWTAIRRHPAVVALVVSMLLHGGLAAWLSSREVVPAPSRSSQATGELVIVDFFEAPKPAPPMVATTPAPAPEETPKPQARAKPKPAQQVPPPELPAASSGTASAEQTESPAEPEPSNEPKSEASRAAIAEAPSQPGASASSQSQPPSPSPSQLSPPSASASSPSASASPAPAPAPRLRTLVPDARLFGGGDFPVSPPAQSGRTLVNDGTQRGPSSEQLAADAKQQLDGWNRELLAEHRVKSGAVDSYFYDLQRSLDEQVEFEMPFDPQVQKLLQESFAGYRESLARYGASGNPGQASHEGELAAIPDDPNAESMNRARAGAAEQTAQVRRHLQNAYGRKPVAIVEVRQTADGRFLEARLLQRSGNESFDAHVMALVPTGVATVREVPDHVQASHPEGLRTIWEFRGEYVLHKKAKDLRVENAGDALYLAAMGATSLLSGMPFDETTLDVYVLDLRDPKFDVDVKLLRVY